MSELKATSSGEIQARKALLGYWWYEKSEADKVIAEKDNVITYARALVREDIKIIFHQKYKRCLAMWLYLRECYWRCQHHNEQTRANWYNKWMNVFQKLADKFKEGE